MFQFFSLLETEEAPVPPSPPMVVEGDILAAATHLGNGVVQVSVFSPLPQNFRRYEVESAPTLVGPYERFSNRFLFDHTGFLYGYLVGYTVYLRIRAELSINGNPSFTDWSQIRASEPSYPRVKMLVEAPAGSLIREGSLFTSQQNNERILGFKADNDIQVGVDVDVPVIPAPPPIGIVLYYASLSLDELYSLLLDELFALKLVTP